MSRFLQFETDLDNFIVELQELLKQNNTRVEELLKQEQKSYSSFVKPMQLMEERLEHFFTPLSHLNAVNNSQETQDIYSEALPIITEYSTKLSQNLEIYRVYKEILAQQKDTLNSEQLRVVQLNIEHFEKSGAHLDTETKKRLEEINLRLSELSNDFSQNLLNATNDFEYIITDAADVEGLPESEILSAKQEDEAGNISYKFTLQMPSYLAYMTYGKNATIREALYRAYTTRAPENGKLIEEILALKDERSKLLGFENYVAYSLSSKMAHDGESVINFLDSLLKNSKEQAKSELLMLQAIAPQPLRSFDTAYYAELLKKEQYEIDEEEYRPYFEQRSVVRGMFLFLEKIFGIRFEKVDCKLWHEKAFAYDIYTAENRLQARVLFDLEARESKRGGAWMHNWQSHHRDENDQEQLASAFVVCNFPPSSESQPSLLRHDDVVTLFHEMGHTIHHLLSTVDENEVSGVNGVEWDAVEFPSQFLENFAYEPEVLKMFASHHETGERLPTEMIEKLVKSKNFLSAMGMLRQLEFSLFDMKIHTKNYSEEEVQATLDEIREETSLIQTPEYNKFQNGFAHIFAGGYAAGYYSYKWAEVLSADAFYAVVDEGIFQSSTAKRYRDIILKKGGSQSMSILFKELMGRDPNTDQLLRLNGIE